MSVERDALKKAIGIINFTHPNTWHEFISEVEELLAQPEQKREPLSDESICEILLKKEWKGFVELVRAIEKAHGITGVDDE